MARIIIDHQEVECEDGIMLVEAARDVGIEIPTLCYHRAISPYGACRVCTVEVTEGERTRLVASCSYPVRDGIAVRTRSPEVLKMRKLIMELLLARCPDVPRIQELAREYGVPDEPRFEHEGDDCILCGLCVQCCSEVVGAHAINYVGRGDHLRVTTPWGEPNSACIACGACALVCPTGAIKIEEMQKFSHRDLALSPNRALYIPFAQAVPNAPVVDREHCIHEKTGMCRMCELYCKPGALNHDQQPETEEIDVGTIIVATGYRPFDAARAPQYGYGRLPNVLTGLEFEIMSNAGGPTGGKIVMEDGTAPKSVGIIHCVGSRDENYNKYCSRVCCMYAMKFAHLVREKVDADVYEFYIDIRAFGKGYEEFYDRLMSEDVAFIRGKGAEVTDDAETPEEEGKLIVRCEDTLLGLVRRVPVDMVLLAVGLEPRPDADEVAKTFSLSCAHGGFFLELHPKLAPVATSTDGVFIAGACQGPKDIPDAVAQGAAAAAEALALIDAGSVSIEPITSVIDEELCAGCKTCLELCPYSAIEFNEEKRISEVVEALCKGCGTCVAACPSGAARQRGFNDQQILAEIEGAMSIS